MSLSMNNAGSLLSLDRPAEFCYRLCGAAGSESGVAWCCGTMPAANMRIAAGEADYAGKLQSVLIVIMRWRGFAVDAGHLVVLLVVYHINFPFFRLHFYKKKSRLGHLWLCFVKLFICCTITSFIHIYLKTFGKFNIHCRHC